MRKKNLKNDGRQQTADAVCDEICMHITTGSVSIAFLYIYYYIHANPAKLVRVLYNRYN